VVCRSQPQGRIFVHLVYLDDSSDNSETQVLVAVIVPDKDMLIIEKFLGLRIEMFVPEELRQQFEFHAFKLWKREGEFSTLTEDQKRELFEGTAAVVADSGISLVYGAVNLKALRASYYSTAQPTNVAFRLCMEGLHKWFTETQQPHDVGILICDEMNPNVKKEMQQAYRAFRNNHKRGKSFLEISDIRDYLHDDLYFGDSAYSVGLQLADMCAFLIRHHLGKREDTEYLYKKIEHKIYFAKSEPDTKT
jgi:hypothetical protein